MRAAPAGSPGCAGARGRPGLAPERGHRRPRPRPARARLWPALERAIDGLFAARKAPAAVLIVNSPGGSPVQSALIAARIRDLAAEKKRPVLAFVEDVAASGGYWLACAADEIFANACSIVGSIGVISAGFGFTDAIARLGIERRVHTAGARKGLLDPFRPEEPDDLELLRELQLEIHEQFKAHVREPPRRPPELPEDILFDGRIWAGQAALEAGLVDGIGEVKSIVRAALRRQGAAACRSTRRGRAG